MQKRLDTRNAISKGSTNIFSRVYQCDWHELLDERDNCVLDLGEYRDEGVFLSYSRNPLVQPAWKRAVIRLGIMFKLW